MSDSASRVRLYAAAVAACLAIELIILAWPEAKTEADGRVGRGVSGEIAGPVSLSQRFTATAPGLRSIMFYARPSGRAVAGPVDLELVELRKDDRRVVDHRRVDASEVVAGDRYWYRFDRILGSHNRVYLLTVSMPETTPGSGIVVEIMKHEYGGNPPNVLYFGGGDRYGSLRFTTEIDRPTMLERTIAYLSKGAFGKTTILPVAAAWVALHLLGLRAILTLPDVRV